MIKFLKQIFDFYLTASMHVALSVFSLVQITCIKFQKEFDLNVSLFAFFGTIVGYNFIKYDELTRVKKIQPNNTLKATMFISFLAFFFCLYNFFQLNFYAKIISILSLLITVIYTLPLLPGFSNFRNWSGMKIYLVAISWGVITVFLPLINSNSNIGFDIVCEVEFLIYLINRIILVFVLMLIFEIVDLQNDEAYLKTIPQQIGVRNTKKLGYGLLFLLLLIELFTFHFSLFTFFIYCISAISLFFASQNKSKYYTSFWVEAIPIVWFLLITLF